jgi:hypothetical protein
MRISEFKQKIREHLSGLDLRKVRQFTMDADCGTWTIRTGMYEDVVEVKINFLHDGKMMKAFVYEEYGELLIQVF